MTNSARGFDSRPRHLKGFSLNQSPLSVSTGISACFSPGDARRYGQRSQLYHSPASFAFYRPSTFDFDFFFFFFSKLFFLQSFSPRIQVRLWLSGAGGGKVAKLKLKGIDGSRPPEDFSKQQARARRPRSQGLVPVSVYRRSRPDHPRNYSKFFSANPSHVP